ncbi:MAG: acyl-[acyl-carrier-protein] thioesterase [Acetatifactor sp.]|nr:acyl-[acyl-carrier-protein] thioesterase [Acetatifactor sp.]
MYTFNSRIRYSETDCDGKLTMASLLNYFQDCSTFQSEDLGLGFEYCRKENLVWVLSSWQIVVDRYPDLGEEVVIGTLPYEFKAFLGSRNFAMMTKDGERIAVANTLWSLLNAETGKPAVPTKEILDGFRLEEKLPMEYAPRKIKIPEGGFPADPIVVKKYHLDTNHHVNNGQYVDIAMEFLPENFVIGQLRAEYKMQAFLNDIFYPYVVLDPDKCIVSLADEEGKPYACVEFVRKEQ